MRILEGTALSRAVSGAIAAGKETLAARLPITILRDAWTADFRLTLPELATDCLFGVGKIEKTVTVWGTPTAIEIWSDAFWLTQLNAIATEAAEFTGER